MIAGILLFTQIPAHGSYLTDILPGLILMGAGAALCVPAADQPRDERRAAGRLRRGIRHDERLAAGRRGDRPGTAGARCPPRAPGISRRLGHITPRALIGGDHLAFFVGDPGSCTAGLIVSVVVLRTTGAAGGAAPAAHSESVAAAGAEVGGRRRTMRFLAAHRPLTRSDDQPSGPAATLQPPPPPGPGGCQRAHGPAPRTDLTMATDDLTAATIPRGPATSPASARSRARASEFGMGARRARPRCCVLSGLLEFVRLEPERLRQHVLLGGGQVDAALVAQLLLRLGRPQRPDHGRQAAARAVAAGGEREALRLHAAEPARSPRGSARCSRWRCSTASSRRASGRSPALVSAFALAVFPSFVAVSRDNGVDPLLILLMLAACGVGLAAIDPGSLWRLVRAACSSGSRSTPSRSPRCCASRGSRSATSPARPARCAAGSRTCAVGRRRVARRVRVVGGGRRADAGVAAAVRRRAPPPTPSRS